MSGHQVVGPGWAARWDCGGQNASAPRSLAAAEYTATTWAHTSGDTAWTQTWAGVQLKPGRPVAGQGRVSSVTGVALQLRKRSPVWKVVGTWGLSALV